MRTEHKPGKQLFVSPSVRQRKRTQAMLAGSSGIVNEALRDLDARAVAWPGVLDQANRVPTSRDDLSAAYLRMAAGSDLLRDCLVRTEDHVVIVVREGDLVIESAQCPFAVKQGDGAIVPAGWWRITELPAANSPISYWIIFFSPALIQVVIGDRELSWQAAAQVVPAFSGVYVQRGLLRALRFHGCDGPVPDVEKTLRAINALAGASFFMFLQKYYYAPRDDLQRLVRVCLSNRIPAEHIGVGWPGGPGAFRREFKLYHGLSVRTWVRGWRQQGRRFETDAASASPS